MKHLLATMALALVGCGGCKVIVLGDSNSCAWICVGNTFYWPGRHRLPLPFVLDNQSKPGMAAGAYKFCSNNPLKPCTSAAQCGADATCNENLLRDGLPGSGMWRLEQVIAAYAEHGNHACFLASLRIAPKLVVALGTNDLGTGENLTGLVVGQTVLALYDRAHQAQPCVDIYVATIPLRIGIDPLKIQQANATIQIGMLQRGADARVIPFGTQPTSDLGPDGVHMTGPAQEHRWQLAFPVLFP